MKGSVEGDLYFAELVAILIIEEEPMEIWGNGWCG